MERSPASLHLPHPHVQWGGSPGQTFHLLLRTDLLGSHPECGRAGPTGGLRRALTDVESTFLCSSSPSPTSRDIEHSWLYILL